VLKILFIKLSARTIKRKQNVQTQDTRRKTLNMCISGDGVAVKIFGLKMLTVYENNDKKCSGHSLLGYCLYICAKCFAYSHQDKQSTVRVWRASV